MSKHCCPRCGFESRHRSWPERHPAATAVIALPTMYTLVGVILAYPWFVVPLLVIGAAVWVDRRNRARQAVAARADYEHRQIIARAVFPPKPRRDRPAGRNVTRRRVGADHWSPTQPIRAGRR